MKKFSRILSLCLALVMALGLFTVSAFAEDRPHFDKLTLEFVPSKDADVIIAGTANLPQLVKDEMARLGYDIDEVDITVGTSYDATGEAMSAGSIDIGWLPGGTYALYSDDTEVILTATRNGLSNDSENPADWNGEANATQKNGPQVTFYRALIYATPSEYGRMLAEKVNNGEALTWEDLDGAKWAVQKTSSSAGYIYPTMWLMEHYDGKKISDLSNVIPLDSGYGTAFSYAAAEQVDVQVPDRLRAVAAAVGDHAEAAFVDALLLRDGSDGVRQRGCGFGVALQDVREVLLRHDQHVDRRLGIDVPEGIDPVVFIYLCAGNVASDDLAKQTIVHDRFTPCRLL